MGFVDYAVGGKAVAVAPFEGENVVGLDGNGVGGWDFAEDVAGEIGEGEVFDGPGAGAGVGAVGEGGFGGAGGAVESGRADAVVGALVDAVYVDALGRLLG